MIRKTGNERTKLETVIPLNTPYVVHIETTNVCNFKCKFCFASDDLLTKKFRIERGFMSYELFCKIIDDMQLFENKVRQLLFHVTGEPLCQKDIIKMISYAKRQKVAEKLVLFTNGYLLTPQLCREIMQAGIDVIQISVEAVDDIKYKELTGVTVSYNKIVGNVAYLYACRRKDCFINVKILDCGLSDDDKKKFYDDFTPIASECHIENLIDTLPSDYGDTTLGMGQGLTHDGYQIEHKEVCTQPFYLMAVNYNGTVSACSCDYGRRMIMGNVTNESLVNIWRGDKYDALRKMQLLMSRKDCEQCRDCPSLNNQIDNIDKYAAELLKKMS